MTQTKAGLAISRARAALILDQPFFGTLALRLIPHEGGCDTMATDGKSLFYNPAWVEAQGRDEITGVVAHEVMHCAMTHMTRRGNRDHGKFNIAADYAINPLLLDAGFKLPPDGLVDPAYKGMAAEQIYARLPDDNGGKGKGPPGAAGSGAKGPLAPGEVWDAPGEDGAPAGAAERESAAREWEVAVLQAAQQAKAAGKLPGFASEMAKAIRAPEIDWRDALRRYLSATARNDYSWRRPNHRHLAAGDYLPSLYSESMGEIMIAVDTSGSVSDIELTSFAAEVNGILDQTRPEKTHVVYCDARVQRTEEYQPDDYPVTLTCPGRGGTRFAPVFDWAAEHGVEPVCAVYLTDLECSDFGPEPGYPVLWVSTAQTAAPWGEVVRLRV